jgi:shikimate kinase
MSNIIIIGMAGVGKTTVGKLLAEKLDMTFFDLDKNIETRCGVEVTRIFEIEGEAGFRKRETDELQRIFDTYSNFVLSVGGGCIVQSANREILCGKPSNQIIQLYADINVVIERIAKSPLKRPLFTSNVNNIIRQEKSNLVSAVNNLYLKRKSDYDSISDIMLNTSSLKPNQVVDKIIELIN